MVFSSTSHIERDQEHRKLEEVYEHIPSSPYKEYEDSENDLHPSGSVPVDESSKAPTCIEAKLN